VTGREPVRCAASRYPLVMRAVGVVGLVLAALSIAVSSASADTPRQLAVSWPAPTQPASLSPEPPIVDTDPYFNAASIAYDYATGTVIATMGFYDPAYWQSNQLPYDWGITIDLATDCSGNAATDLTVYMEPTNTATDGISNINTSAVGHATLTGYAGSVQGQGSFDGTNYSLTVQSPDFVGLDFRCADFSPASDAASGWEYLSGWAPTPLTIANATAAFANLLPSGVTFPGGEGAFCPEILTGEQQPWSQCFAEYHQGDLWHLADGQAQQTSLLPSATLSGTTTWTRRWARCTLRKWPIPGVLTSNNNCGTGAPQSDAYFVGQELWWGSKSTGHLRHVSEVGWQFTDSAGFGPVGVYSCTRSRRTVTCTTRLGDSFRYTP
jgi:hypothetical protein